MLRLLAVIAAAAARPEDATAYFDAASSLWPPASTAGRCLAQQRKYGWRPKPHGSNFKTLGTEGVGHHWLEGLMPARRTAASTASPAPALAVRRTAPARRRGGGAPSMTRRRSGGSIRPSCRDCWRRARNRSRPSFCGHPVS